MAAAAHTAGMLAGSALTGLALVGLAHLLGPLPDSALAAICLAAAVALVAQTRVAVPLPGSRWMVPREWARFGTTGYAALFGLALGTGVATLLPSPAFYAVLAAGLAAPAWWQAVVLLLGFGAARAGLVPLLTARSVRRRLPPPLDSDRLREAMARLGFLEVALLACLAVEAIHR
jgi:hypothetical protein